MTNSILNLYSEAGEGGSFFSMVMMIAAMAFAAGIFRERKYLDAAEKAADFIEKELTKKDCRLMVRYRDREVGQCLSGRLCI